METPSQLVVLLLLAAAAAPILPAIAEQRGLEEQQAMARPGCQDKCGDMSIPIPFGIGKAGCFLPGFEVTCDSSSHPPRALLAYNRSAPFRRTITGTHMFNASGGRRPPDEYNPVELMDISVADNEARVYSAVSSDCSKDAVNFVAKSQITYLGDDGPFLLSVTRNVLIGVGSNVESLMATLFEEKGTWTTAYMPSCLSNLMANLEYATNGTCSGLGCCLAALPQETDPVSTFGTVFIPRRNYLWETTPCFFRMGVEKSRYNFSTRDLNGLGELYPKGVPVVLDFAIRNLGSCPAEGQQPPPGYACVSGNSTCNNTARGAYVCKCLEHYHGNPYITGGGGCTDIDECKLPGLYNCSRDGICSNRLNGYDCPCKPGMKGDGKTEHCVEISPCQQR